MIVRNEDAGFVRAGQRAQLKVAAFPFQKYGLIDAEVLRIGPDATEVERQSAVGRRGATARAAIARASRFPRNRWRSTVRDCRSRPGMFVSAEIHLGHRAVLHYLLAPVQKAWHEAARER